MFSDDEVAKAWEMFRKEGMRQVMALAVELAAARGGTMTAEALAGIRASMTGPDHMGRAMQAKLLFEHISTLGTRLAWLEFGEALLRERLSAAEGSNRELVRRAQHAESERDKWKMEAETWGLRVKRAAEELADIGKGELGTLDIVSRVRMLKARCATLQDTGQSERLVLDNVRVTDRGSVVLNERGMWWPCSPNCTHDDAAKPGHPERVKELSGAWNDAIARDAEAASAFDRGAEAVRAACWEAVQRAMEEMGVNCDAPYWNRMKAAIEGAVP